MYDTVQWMGHMKRVFSGGLFRVRENWRPLPPRIHRRPLQTCEWPLPMCSGDDGTCDRAGLYPVPDGHAGEFHYCQGHLNLLRGKRLQYAAN